MPYKRLSCLYDEIESNTLFKARLEPGNEFDKFSVAVEKFDIVVGNLSKEKTGRFAKTITFFLRGSNENSCKVEVTGKRVNSGDGKGLQIPCKLHLAGYSKNIDKLKDILPTLL